MTQWEMLKIRAYLFWIDLKMFFRYTLLGKKTPKQELMEKDPYIYEDE